MPPSFFFPFNTAAQVHLLSLFKKKDSTLSTCKTHWGAGELFVARLVVFFSLLETRPIALSWGGTLTGTKDVHQMAWAAGSAGGFDPQPQVNARIELGSI